MLERTAHPATIGEALKDAADRLSAAGLPGSRREATMLWAAVAGGGTKPGDVWLQRDRHATLELLARFWQAVGHRASGIPFAYAVGRTGFRTLDLKLDARALIPRPETEELVDLVLKETGKREAGGETGGVVADIGTGCGCIALSLAVEGSFDRVIAIDRSAGAAALTRENVAAVGPPTRIATRPL